MTTAIGKDEALRALRECVEERGTDYVYPKHDDDHNGVCSYYIRAEPGVVKPDCMVGLALHKLLPEAQWMTVVGPIGEVDESVQDRYHIQEVAGELGIDITSEAVRVLSAAQRSQDQLQPWGEALKQAERQAEYL